MPKRTEAYMNDRREQIFAALQRCIVRDGWERATIDEIAREAKLSKGALYVHYPSKRALMIGMMEHNRNQIDHYAKTLSMDELRELALSELVTGTGEDGWRHSTGILEVYAAAARDEEARKMFGKSFLQATAALIAKIRKVAPQLPAREARIWTFELVALMRGLGVLQAIGASPTKSEVKEMLDRHFARLDSACNEVLPQKGPEPRTPSLETPV